MTEMRNPLEIDRRRDFIRRWREQATAALVGETEAALLTPEEHLAHVEKLRSEYTSTPCAPLRGYVP